MLRPTHVVQVGERYGRFTVTETGFSKGQVRRVGVRCDCGNERVVRADQLRLGRTRSCGCLRREWMRELHNGAGQPAEKRIGQRHGRLVVSELLSKSSGTWRVRCSCDCGAEHIALLSNIISGVTKSCGCLNREVAAARATTHGFTGTRLHGIWGGIKTRCLDEGSAGFVNYGGRGIGICLGWRHSFESFAADMGERPSPAHSIDRIDNNGGYWCGHCDECVSLNRPANCRWATKREQGQNTRRSVYLNFNGERIHSAELCRRFGIHRQTYAVRVKAGMDPVAAATTPPLNPVSEGARARMSASKRARDAARLSPTQLTMKTG